MSNLVDRIKDLRESSDKDDMGAVWEALLVLAEDADAIKAAQVKTARDAGFDDAWNAAQLRGIQ